jgi:hypothetical protein
MDRCRLPERVDLRADACAPYPDAFDQGEAQSCVAQAFGTAFFCLKARARLPLFPRSGLGFPEVAEVFRGALETSPDPQRGASFQGVLQRLLQRHAEDLAALGWRWRRLANDDLLAKRLLHGGAPIVAGYQVNAATAIFHASQEACERHGYLLPSFRRDPHAVSAHAVLLVGYDDRVGAFLARNSWGLDWGVDGHFLVRYEDFRSPQHFTDAVGFEATAEAGAAAPAPARD